MNFHKKTCIFLISGVTYAPEHYKCNYRRYFAMKRILVTGGGGFLGSWLCEKLLEKGNEVICLDNFYTGTRRNV